jgi:hypothetical protein
MLPSFAGGSAYVFTASLQSDYLPPGIREFPPALGRRLRWLMFTFVLGTGGVLIEPAYQSLVPDMVRRPQVPAASALGSISINLARAIGPAIGGLLVARIRSAAVFGLNTAAFVVYAVVLAFHRRLGGAPQSAERFIPGALWALLPLIAASRLGLGSVGRAGNPIRNVAGHPPCEHAPLDLTSRPAFSGSEPLGPPPAGSRSLPPAGR